MTFEIGNKITDACFSWCQEQHYINDNSGIWLIVLTLASFSIVAIAYMNANYIIKNTEGMDEHKLLKYIENTFLFGLLMLIGFFVKFLYF